MLAATTSPWYLPTWVSGQMPVTSPIAHTRSAARSVRVDRDAVPVGLDADRLQADALDTRAPPGGDQQAVAAQLATVIQLEHVVRAVVPRRRGVDTQRQLDALAAQHVAERLPERRGLPWKHVVTAFDQRHLAAETADGLRHLDADRAAAEHEHPPGHGLHPGHLAVGPEPIDLAQARDRRDERVGAGRDDDVLGRVADAVHLDGARSREPAGAPQQVDPGVGQPPHLAGVGVLRDHEVAACNSSRLHTQESAGYLLLGSSRADAGLKRIAPRRRASDLGSTDAFNSASASNIGHQGCRLAGASRCFVSGK